MTGQPVAAWQPAKSPVNPAVRVRVANETDLESLTDLALEEHLHHALHTHTGSSPDQPRATSRKIAEETLTRPANRCCQLIAEIQQEGSSNFTAAGSIVGVIIEVEENHLARFYTPARYGYIGLTSVSARVRGQGVGRAMVERLWPWFVEQQVETVFLHYIADNVLSNGFWSHMGFAPFQEGLSFRDVMTKLYPSIFPKAL
jgi:ribosomal protein S18 acetylase RimI-like enzyme